MNIPQAVQDRLDEIERNTIWLAGKSTVSKSPLYAFMQGKSSLTIENLELVATKGLKIKLSTLIKDAENYE